MRFSKIALAAAALVLMGSTLTAAPRDDSVEVKGFRTTGGVVSVLSGRATCIRTGSSPRALVRNEQLETGDVLRVEGDGRAEILLNPGYFLRVTGGTEIVFLDLSPENIKLDLRAGSALVEVSVLNPYSAFSYVSDDVVEGIYELVTVATPQGPTVIAEGGVYRFRVGPDGETAVHVVEGSADVAGAWLQSGARAIIRGGAIATRSVDKDAPEDDLERWSRERSTQIVSLNRSLEKESWYRQMKSDGRSHFEIADAASTREVVARSTVSATGGDLTFVEPGDAILRPGAGWAPAASDDRLEPGDRLRTSSLSRAALRLFALCQLQLSWNSEVAYVGRPEGRAVIQVVSGSAMAVSRVDQHLVSLNVAGETVDLLRDGVYRVNVASDGSAELIVLRGRVRCRNDETGDGKTIGFAGGKVSVRSTGKRPHDGFEIWSRQQSAWLPGRAWASIDFLRRRRAQFGGVWYAVIPAGEFTFVPGAWDFRSPYGGKYSVRFRAWARQRAFR